VCFAVSWSNDTSSLSGERRQNVHVQRDLLSKRRRVARLKKRHISDDAVTEVKPRQVRRGSRIRSPGRPHGVSSHQRSFRLPQTFDHSTVSSASTFETAVEDDENAEKVHTEDSELSETASAAELNQQYVMNGDHDYYQMTNNDPLTDRWPANGMVFDTYKCLDLINHTVTDSSDNKSSVGRRQKALESSSFGFYNGAKMTSTRNTFLRGVEADHTYAKRPPTPEQSCPPQHIADSDVDSVHTRFTILNTRSSQLRRPSCHNYTASLPCLQKCSVTLSKLNDALLKQQPTVRLQLCSLEQQHCRSIEQHSAVEEVKPHSCQSPAVSDAAPADNCLPSVCSGMSIAKAPQTVDMCNLISHPADFTFASSSGEGLGCGAWLPSAVSHNSGLELLASVSSLTADRMQEQELSDPVDAGCSNNEQHSVAASPSTYEKHRVNNSCSTVEMLCTSPDDNYQHSSQVTSNATRRRIKVFCVRKKCTVDAQTGLCHDDLLNVVRDYIAQGSSGPVCGTLPCRVSEHELAQTHGSCSQPSDETACNSVQLMHSSCASLQNGLTELA